MWLTDPPLAIDFRDIEAAAKRLQGVAHRTPVLTSRIANARCGADIYFKAESFQRMGAFKFRGAYNALAQFSPDQRSAGVVAFSSGNHAQAIAYAARLLGIPNVIIMPQDAPISKINATRGYQENQKDCEVLLYDRYSQDREEISRRLADERGMTLIPPFNHPDIMAGQGTAALELIEQVEELTDGGALDSMLVCVGGGGLLAGSAVAAKQLSASIELWGVEPEAGNDVQQSLSQGKIVSIDTPKTIADGAQTQQCGSLTFPIIQRFVQGVVTVSDLALIDTMRWMAERMKIIIEPTGALGAAALFSQANGLPDMRGKKIGVILSGGNIDIRYFSQLVSG